ncbi:polysialyltransferase family glycosyltransferase [Sulfurimonas sp.]|uniref:polysialyltransferase family glycosyltransferase n=1 Tax=Sulfurimonas sp. TaxID=2022749 RepID=UPI002A363CC6|nr:polysialyltransferase family glycosyltransferase [Sulfurimonas sp.]MDY0123319.1 polysialyltransferase family glycosyltransferase [Sulfurimonas sp.]
MKNLFIVSSPFQCISALEAKTQLALENNIIVAVYYSNDGSNTHKQMREIFKLSEWNEIVEIGLERKKSKYFEYISIINKLKQYEYKNVFTGHFGQFQNILLSNLITSKIYALDDGSATLRWHKSELNPNIKSEVKFSKKMKILRYSLIGLKTYFDRKRVNYFTMFDLKPYYGETIVQNKFIFMRRYTANKTVDNSTVYFIGQPLYGEKLVEKNVYFEFLENIKRYFVKQNKKIIYIPHRREENLEEFGNIIDDNFKIQRLPTSVEIHLLSLDILPAGICSFYSTALFSINKIFNIDTIAVYLNSEFLNYNQDGIENTYDEFKKNNIKILKREDI